MDVEKHIDDTLDALADPGPKNDPHAFGSNEDQDEKAKALLRRLALERLRDEYTIATTSRRYFRVPKFEEWAAKFAVSDPLAFEGVIKATIREAVLEGSFSGPSTMHLTIVGLYSGVITPPKSQLEQILNSTEVAFGGAVSVVVFGIGLQIAVPLRQGDFEAIASSSPYMGLVLIAALLWLLSYWRTP